jgi:threonine dehydratase
MSTDTVHTIADGVAVRVPVPEAVAEMAHTVDDMVLVGDEMIVEAMQVLFRSLGLVVEGAGAIALAASTRLREELAGKNVAILICGGNLSAEELRRLFL